MDYMKQFEAMTEDEFYNARYDLNTGNEFMFCYAIEAIKRFLNGEEEEFFYAAIEELNGLAFVGYLEDENKRKILKDNRIFAEYDSDYRGIYVYSVG